MADPFSLPFVQRGVVEILILAVVAGALGTWIVLRGLAFYTHAVAAAAFPGLVLADGLGFAAGLGAFGSGLIFALAVGRLSARHSSGHDSVTALALVAALALGIALASDVFHSGSEVDTLLFGSLLAISPDDQTFAGAAAVVALAASALLGRRWLATGFDRGAAVSLGVRSARSDALLLLVVALAAVATLEAVGALLASALLVVPAATTRLLVRRMPAWQLSTGVLAALEGIAGLWLSVKTNAPPGATIAVLAGGAFAMVAVARGLGPMLLRRLVAVASALTGTGSGAVVATAVLVGTVALALAGCGSSGSTSGGRPEVVATTTQLGDFVRAVAGGQAVVHQILQPNTDPHEYEPRPRDVEDTAGAKLVVLSGDRLDAWMGKVIHEAGGSPVRLTVAPSNTPHRVGGDPHWWHDPRNAAAAVVAIRDALIRIDPHGAPAFRANAARYLAALRRLDSGIARCFTAVPPGQRRLVTSHDAFGYFARRYGITIVGAVIPSQTTQAQPSAGQIARLAALVRREHVKAIYPESSINPRLADALARETGASARFTLYGDTLGPKGSRGDTYLKMELANADAMVRGFTGGARGCAIAGL